MKLETSNWTAWAVVDPHGWFMTNTGGWSNGIGSASLMSELYASRIASEGHCRPVKVNVHVSYILGDQ